MDTCRGSEQLWWLGSNTPTQQNLVTSISRTACTSPDLPSRCRTILQKTRPDKGQGGGRGPRGRGGGISSIIFRLEATAGVRGASYYLWCKTAEDPPTPHLHCRRGKGATETWECSQSVTTPSSIETSDCYSEKHSSLFVLYTDNFTHFN